MSEDGMSLRLRGESNVQARRPFYLSIVQLFIHERVCVQIPNRLLKERQCRHSFWLFGHVQRNM